MKNRYKLICSVHSIVLFQSTVLSLFCPHFLIPPSYIDARLAFPSPLFGGLMGFDGVSCVVHYFRLCYMDWDIGVRYKYVINMDIVQFL